MKQIKKYSGILILTFLFIHCEKDIVVVEDTTAVLAATPDFKVKAVSAKQLSKIIRFLEIENHIPLFQKDTIAGAIFDMDNIVEVIDGLNTTNYSLRFVYPDTPEHIFYNLVVGTNGQGEYTAPYVLKYECDASQLQAFVTSNYNFHYFKGTISYHRFTDFFQGEVLFSKTTTDCTEFDQYGDPLACEEVSIDGSGPSGSGGSSEFGGSTNGETVPGTGSPGGTGGFSITVYHIIPSGDWYVFGPGSVCQHPGECEIVIAMNGQDNQQRTATECPPCTLPTGGVGVNAGDIDLEDEHISIDPQFLADYPCQAQIVQEVYGNCAPLSQLFQDIFESNDNVHVTFTTEDLNNIFWGGYTQTIVGQPLDYTIKLNTERLDQSTELDIINVTVHEYVHAILNYFYQAGGFQISVPTVSPTYEELVEGFTQHRADFYSEANQHEYMTSLVHDIAEVTYNWATANGYDPDDFISYDEDPADAIDGLKGFLRKLAWGGLKNTPTFEASYPDGTLEEQTIQKIIQDEIFPDAPGAATQGNLPAPCDN